MLHHLHGQAVGLGNQFGGQHFARGAERRDPPRDHQRDAVRVTSGEVEVMQGDQHGEIVLARQFADEIEQADLVLQIEVRGRFVEQEDRRGLAQGARQQNPLTLAAG